MSFGKRFADRRKEMGITQKQMAEMLEVSQSAVASWESDTNSPRATLLYQVFDILKCDANYLWQDEMVVLANGNKCDTGERLLLSYYDRLNSEGREELMHQINLLLQIPEFTKLKSNEVEYRLIAYYNKIAAAGHAIGSFSDLMQGIIKVIDTPESSNADFAIGVLGESMEPTYCDGDIVLVKKQYDLKPGEIGIFQKDNEIYIKEMREDGLYSHNPKYAPIKDESEVRVLGKVIGKAVLA